MKIKTLFLKGVTQTKGYVNTIQSTNHTIVYVPEMDSYLVDNTTLIPSSNVNEVVVDMEIVPITKEALVELPKKTKK